MCAVFEHATSTQGSADARWNGKPEHTGRADQSAYFIEFCWVSDRRHKQFIYT